MYIYWIESFALQEICTYPVKFVYIRKIKKNYKENKYKLNQMKHLSILVISIYLLGSIKSENPRC